MLLLLSVELSIKFDCLHLEPVNPLAQVRDSVIVHQCSHCLVLRHLQEFELLSHFFHLTLIGSLEIALVSQQLGMILAINALRQNHQLTK